MKPSYCYCCGEKTETILAELEKLPFVDGKREWNNHKQTEYWYKQEEKNHSDFSECGMDLKFCEQCGEGLNEEDIHGEWEQIGEPWMGREYIVTGYTCCNCGNEAKF